MGQAKTPRRKSKNVPSILSGFAPLLEEKRFTQRRQDAKSETINRILSGFAPSREKKPFTPSRQVAKEEIKEEIMNSILSGFTSLRPCAFA